MQLSQKGKFFSNFFFFFHLLNLESILHILEEKMTLIAVVFLSLWTPKKRG